MSANEANDSTEKDQTIAEEPPEGSNSSGEEMEEQEGGNAMSEEVTYYNDRCFVMSELFIVAKISFLFRGLLLVQYVQRVR